MSESEIKPVAWYVRWDAPNHREDGRRTDLSFSERHVDEQAEFDFPAAKLTKVGLYDQSAIDALTKQISELKTMLSIAEFQRKEVQEERDEAFAAADSKAGWEWKRRAEKAEAERDAAVADAERYRWLRTRFRVSSLDMSGQHGYAPTGEVGRIKGPSLDAAIDAAIAQEGQA